MARIREALQRAETPHGQPADRGPGPHPYQPAEDQVRAEVGEEIPFIEVGGRETPVEASALVLAGNLKSAGANPGRPVERAEPVVLAKAGETGAAPEVEFAKVIFRSFPPQPAPRRLL